MNLTIIHLAQATAGLLSVSLGMIALLPLLLMASGMALGFAALGDIRRAGGRLGGAVAAVLAAGLLPSLLIIACCVSAVSLATEPSGPMMHPRLPLARSLGLAAGCWLSFLMMRSWHRRATGWDPAVDGRGSAARGGTGTAARILTIIGAVLMLLQATARQRRWLPGLEEGQAMLLLLSVLIGGLICGVLARHESGGRTCAWVCGSLLIIVLATTA